MHMARGLILFVHGLGGDAKATWGRFPDYIAADGQLKDFDVGFFQYPTAVIGWAFWTRQFWKNIGRNFSKIATLADALRTLIDVRYPQHRPIVLVAHSLGGLIARQYLVDAVMGERPLRVSKLLLFAVPNTGSGLANVARHLSWGHPHLRQLAKGADALDNLNNSWTMLKLADKVAVRYVVAGDDDVVGEASARQFPGNPDVDVVLERDHRSIVKPASSDDLAFGVLRRFALAAPAPVARRPAGLHDYRLVAFDLDGTLIRGLKFSWTLVWEALGYPADTHKAGMRRYLHGEISYAEWCEWAVKMFRVKGLTRDRFKTILQGATVTANLEQAVKCLRENNIATAIISGGIDTILYELIPNADTLFDHIFINRLRFDAEGLIEGVDATAYDFKGKAAALQKICDERGISTEQAVFVGDGFNDAHVASTAGLSIAYPPRDYETEAAAHILIREDDLMKVVEHVLGGAVAA
jgi:HAD superfamily phosphoserine phosphatase-like hydrolase